VLDSPVGVTTGGESGPAIVPGKPDESLLYQRVHEGSMPPDEKGRLTASEIAAIRRWIEGGARASREAGEHAGTGPAAITQNDVIPIMLRHCTGCHGLLQREGGLDLRTKAAMLRGGKSGPAILPGNPEKSLVLKRILANQMPPPNRLVEGSVKPVDQSEVELLVRWIAAGAPQFATVPDVASTSPDPEVSDKDRDFWSFQPPRPFEVPKVRHAKLTRNPIDAFVLQKLEAQGLSLSPESDRLTLLRRAYFDLTGLPPEPAQVYEFVSDPDPSAYEKLIDRLLDSPRYGERWGNFWLDLAGYADSEGKREQDLPRPHAWRYRDYVIAAFNNDKPYDRFLTEQIAGDELDDYEHAKVITAEMQDKLVATGFLRMVPDATWANITGYVPDRLEVMADEMDVLGSVVMGLTLKCARCHSHKFDPLPQRDYYRMVDVFKGAYDEYEWLKPDVRPGLGPVSIDVRGGRRLPYVTTAERRAWELKNSRIDNEIKAARASLEQLSKGDKQRAAVEARIRTLESQRPPEPAIQALWDRGDPSPTYIYRRGDSSNPGRLVGPGVPSVLTDGKTPFKVVPPWPGAKKTGRRLAFARWLTSSDHPLTARVAVNRVWQRHFGTGIVKTLGNFGKAGARPTHPELLDWLAREFVRGGWSFKNLHRLMMTSSTYRQSSAITVSQVRFDPENTLFSRMPLVRQDAESLYDTLLAIAGRLDETRAGPGDAVEQRADGLVTPVGTSRGWRRIVYVQHLRKRIPTHLESFDYPQMNPNCLERRNSTVVVQALHLMNTGMMHDLAESFARRTSAEVGTDRASQIERIYLIALSRLPTDEEKQVGMQALATFADERARQAGPTAKPNYEVVCQKALTDYCHAILNSAAFLYVD